MAEPDETQRLRCVCGKPFVWITPTGIEFLCQSIGRFKGQQAPAIILVDVDPDPTEQERATRLLFSGMTRATVRLELLVRAGNPFNAPFLAGHA